MSLLFLSAVIPYLVPTAVAAYRDHADKNAIFLINLCLGWTVFFWIVALLWACTSNPHHQIETLGDEIEAGGLKLQGRDPRIDRYGKSNP